MSQCLASATPVTCAPATPVPWVPLVATPYMSQAASTVMLSQELPLNQLSPRGYKRRLDLVSDEEGSLTSSRSRPLFRRRLQMPSERGASFERGVSTVPSTAASGSVGVPVPAGIEDEDLGVIPSGSGKRFRRKGKCFLLTYSAYVKGEDTGRTSRYEGEDTGRTSRYEVVKELVDHLYSLSFGGSSLLQYAVGVTETHDLVEGQWHPDWHCHVIVWAAVGVTETHDLVEGQWHPDWHCHVIVWAADLIKSESLNLWKFKGCRPHERMLLLRPDKGGFPPLAAFKYLKKEADAWEARATVNLPAGIQPWVTSNILERDPDSDRGKILVLWGPSDTGKSALARSWGHHIRFRQNLNSDEFNDDPMVQYAILDDMDWSKTSLKMQNLNSDEFNDDPMVQYAILDDMDWSKTSLKMWVQEDFNFRTSYRSERHCKWGRSAVICSNTKPLVFADCDYSTGDGRDWIDTNCTFVYVGEKLY
ncbi:hypothetical protein RSAG8_12743, partial [Rhizoctonia solani AG-8 WAC10335]